MSITGLGKLHKPVAFTAELQLEKQWMADNSPDYKGATYELVRACLYFRVASQSTAREWKQAKGN